MIVCGAVSARYVRSSRGGQEGGSKDDKRAVMFKIDVQFSCVNAATISAAASATCVVFLRVVVVLMWVGSALSSLRSAFNVLGLKNR